MKHRQDSQPTCRSFRRLQRHMAFYCRISRLRPSLSTPKDLLRKAYHSYEHQSPPDPFNSVEDSILGAALKHVPSTGFTHTTLARGAKDAGYLDVSTNLFPKGPYSLVQYHLVKQRQALAQHTDIINAANKDDKLPGVGAKVKALTWKRLLGNREVIHQYQEVSRLCSR